MKLLAILGLGTVLVGVEGRSADACSPPPCWLAGLRRRTKQVAS